MLTKSNIYTKMALSQRSRQNSLESSCFSLSSFQPDGSFFSNEEPFLGGLEEAGDSGHLGTAAAAEEKTQEEQQSTQIKAGSVEEVHWSWKCEPTQQVECGCLLQ